MYNIRIKGNNMIVEYYSDSHDTIDKFQKAQEEAGWFQIMLTLDSLIQTLRVYG